MDDKLQALMRLPWTITAERDVDEGYWVARVREIPDALATGDSEKELAVEVWDALRASLGMRLEHNDEIPLPRGVLALPWQLKVDPPRPQTETVISVLAHPYRVAYTTVGVASDSDLAVA